VPLTGTTPPWVRYAVLWHVYPLGFLSAPPHGEPGGEAVPRLRGLVLWLDYLIELGANALLLGPVFQSESHGYDITDYFGIDTRLRTDADFDHLVEQAHTRGIPRGRSAAKPRGDWYLHDKLPGHLSPHRRTPITQRDHIRGDRVEIAKAASTRPEVLPMTHVEHDPRRGARSTRSILGSTATAVIIVICVLVVVAGAGSSLGLWRADVVLSGSMRPAFSAGSAVLAVKTSSDSITSGDVVVYLPPPTYGSERVAHRVVSVGKDAAGATTILTKGDNNSSTDPWGPVASPRSVWVVKADVPMLGHVAAYVGQHRVPVALIVASVLLGCLARRALAS
jgi:signal peptidase I